MSRHDTDMTPEDYAAARPYAMVIEWSDPDQKFVVTVPDLRGCRTAGATREEAARNGEEAIASMLATFADSGVPLPKPRFTALDDAIAARATLRSA
jgi:predicted RNase H-like HicB family nuclease